MATCKQCKEFEKCKDDAFINGAKFDPNESAKYCTGFEPITNADRIRAMSDEALVQFLTEEKWNCDNYRVCRECPRYVGDCCLPLDEWLKQPAE